MIIVSPVIACLKRDGTRAETRFGLSAKRTSPFKSAGVSVQSTTGSRGVRISGQRLYRPCSDVQSKTTGYPLHSHLSPSLPLPCITVCHQVPNTLYQRPGWWTGPPPLPLTFFSYHFTRIIIPFDAILSESLTQYLISCKYSKTPFIRLTLDWTGAELSNISDDQTVPILTSVLTNNSLLLLLYFGCTTDQRSIQCH